MIPSQMQLTHKTEELHTRWGETIYNCVTLILWMAATYTIMVVTLPAFFFLTINI